MPEKALKVFDINLRQNFYTKEVIEDSLNICNVLKINDEELVTVSNLFGWQPKSDKDFETIWQTYDFKSCCRNILTKYNLSMLILTCGVNGSYVFTPDGEISELGTPKVEVADTVGAGDSFLCMHPTRSNAKNTGRINSLTPSPSPREGEKS